MNGVRKKMVWAAAVMGMMILLSMNAWADYDRSVRDFPGWNGSGTKVNGPYNSDCFWDDEDEDEDGPGDYDYVRGWYYSPAGWWFQYGDGSWPNNCWKYLNGRWYRFDQGGHMLTGWYTDESGSKYYLNPVDDGMLGAMRTGWQLIDSKAYYFNTMSDGTLGRLLLNTVTPDGYKVGADGAWVQ
ncbi:glucan-binding protein [Lacrimispora sp.]|jgi:hypothetical protein|uniref:glucan-binding protein n=1 Tax=Lacrimispora sp. TaxID=2719234 RepID=UPI0029E3C4BA|nr:hypothetical protein [Lacrimispora sp.]